MLLRIIWRRRVSKRRYTRGVAIFFLLGTGSYQAGQNGFNIIEIVKFMCLSSIELMSQGKIRKTRMNYHYCGIGRFGDKKARIRDILAGTFFYLANPNHWDL